LSVIDEMSRLVLADPNVTAREIAKQLGYAEEKSVYYWLQKSGFAGMREFKKSVLRRALPSPPPRPEPPLARDSGEPGISLFMDSDLKSVRATLQRHLEGCLGHETFAVLLTRTDYYPLASVGDVLVVDPGAPSFQGDLMWASVRGKMHLVRQYGLPNRDLFYVDSGNPGSLLIPDFVSGKVVFILRKCS
jgi:hypothetical protein